MKRLVLTLMICLGCIGILEAQSVWKPINIPGTLKGVTANGDLFIGETGIQRSQDEGETWQVVLEGTYYNHLDGFTISPNGRIFDLPYNQCHLCISDDGGDTWRNSTDFLNSHFENAPMYAVSDDTLFVKGGNILYWTLDGGESWNETIMDFIGEAVFGSILADHTGNVYVSTYSWTIPVDHTGIYTATLDDMTQWTLKTQGGARDMAFDSEGNILAASPGAFYYDNGVYYVNADRFAVTDDDVIFAMKRVDWDNETLFYSTDHGQTYIQCSENIPSTTTAPDPDLELYKGHDNHLYCHGDVWEPTFVSQYYKSIQNVDEIISDIPTNVVHSLWKPIDTQGILLGAGPDGSIFAYNENGKLARSQDEGETWQIVLGQETGFSGFVNQLCFAVSPEGRVFVFNDNQQTVVYSDDNGDTWHQTTSPSPYCAYPTKTGICAPTNDIIVVWAQNGEIDYTLDGGETWNGTILDFMEDHQEISDLLVSENGDVYVSVWYYIGPNIGVYHSTLSDMQNWEIAAFENIGVKDMAFDPEGNVVCAVNFGGDFSGFEYVPGFYAFWANRVAIADNGIVYKTAMTMYDNAVLAYSLDHGEHFYNTIENLPVSQPAPGGEDGFLSKGHDNHLYFLGNGQYWKSIPNANDIPNVISFSSEWYYEIQNDDGSITFQHLAYAADTTVNNKDVKVIIRTNTLYDKHSVVTHEYVYEEFGKVYWWNKTLEEFTVLYDYAAETGDEWTIAVDNESVVMHVDTVEQYEYEGRMFKMLQVSDENGLFSGNILCGVGHLASFFPERLMTRGKNYRVEGIRCYWRDGELVFKQGDRDCDEVYEQIHNGLNEMDNAAFAVYPNPTDDVLFIRTHAVRPYEEYRITNLMGQIVLSGNLNTENQHINVSDLPRGMYFITIGDTTRKFVVR